jgi:hypothetical protein
VSTKGEQTEQQNDAHRLADVGALRVVLLARCVEPECGRSRAGVAWTGLRAALLPFGGPPPPLLVDEGFFVLPARLLLPCAWATLEMTCAPQAGCAVECGFFFFVLPDAEERAAAATVVRCKLLLLKDRTEEEAGRLPMGAAGRARGVTADMCASASSAAA